MPERPPQWLLLSPLIFQTLDTLIGLQIQKMILLVGVGGPRGCTVAHLEEVRHDLIRRVPDSSAIILAACATEFSVSPVNRPLLTSPFRISRT
jgi:hypothetical protein